VRVLFFGPEYHVDQLCLLCSNDPDSDALHSDISCRIHWSCFRLRASKAAAFLGLVSFLSCLKYFYRQHEPQSHVEFRGFLSGEFCQNLRVAYRHFCSEIIFNFEPQEVEPCFFFFRSLSRAWV
jgi:hypothetical protein